MSTERQSDHPERAPTDGRGHMDALRLWLLSGIHQVPVDPRRRLGGNGRARKVLVEDRRVAPTSAGAWQSLASTLDRHTVRGGLTELSAEERQVIMLAYLEGRTNSEIANVLGVSVGTVRRRLQAAIKQLDAYLTRTGSWLSAILLVAAGRVVDASTRLGRWPKLAGSTDWTQVLASTAALGAATAVAIGLTALSPDSIGPRGSPTAGAAAPRVASPSDSGAAVPPRQRPALDSPPTATVVTVADRSHGHGRNDEAISHQHAGVRQPNHGCGRKLTKAPPSVPVSSHASDRKGPPANHPGPGGCKA